MCKHANLSILVKENAEAGKTDDAGAAVKSEAALSVAGGRGHDAL